MAKNGRNRSWKMVDMLAAVVAAAMARRILALFWTKATGKKPPSDPEDPEVALTEALSWAALTGMTALAARVIAIRAVRKGRTSLESETVDATDG